MSALKIFHTSRKDCDEHYETLCEHLEMHEPAANIEESRRTIKIWNVMAEDLCEMLISDGLLDPEEHDYSVED